MRPGASILTTTGSISAPFHSFMYMNKETVRDRAEESNRPFFLVNRQLFVNERSRGLSILDNNKLVALKGGDFFNGVHDFFYSPITNRSIPHLNFSARNVPDG